MKDIKVSDEMHKRLKLGATVAGESIQDHSAKVIEAGLAALEAGKNE